MCLRFQKNDVCTSRFSCKCVFYRPEERLTGVSYCKYRRNSFLASACCTYGNKMKLGIHVYKKTLFGRKKVIVENSHIFVYFQDQNFEVFAKYQDRISISKGPL